MKTYKLLITLMFLPLISLAQPEPWQQLDIETPSAREYATLVEIDGVFFLYGGSDLSKSKGTLIKDGKDILNDLWAYTEGEDWIPKETTGDTPDGRRYHTATNFDGKMYIFGGEIEAGTTTDCWEYDPETNEWYQLPFSEENPKHFHRATAGDNKIWITGGLDLTTGQATGDIWGYDPDSQVWTQGTACPSPRYGHIAYYEDGKVNIIAGRQGDNLLDDAWEYDIAANTWTQKEVAPYPEPTKFAAHDYQDETLFAAGGYIKDEEGYFEISDGSYSGDAGVITWTVHSQTPALTELELALFPDYKNGSSNGFRAFVYGVSEDGNGNYTGETWIYNSADDPLLGYPESIFSDKPEIFPTLTSRMVHIHSKKTIHEIEVYNMQGQLMKGLEVLNSNLTIDFSYYNSGIYFIKLRIGDEIQVQKVILSK